MIVLKACYVYGIFLPGLNNLPASICLGILYGLVILAVAYPAILLTLDDPTEFATTKTKYYRQIKWA